MLEFGVLIGVELTDAATVTVAVTTRGWVVVALLLKGEDAIDAVKKVVGVCSELAGKGGAE